MKPKPGRPTNTMNPRLTDWYLIKNANTTHQCLVWSHVLDVNRKKIELEPRLYCPECDMFFVCLHFSCLPQKFRCNRYFKVFATIQTRDGKI